MFGKKRTNKVSENTVMEKIDEAAKALDKEVEELLKQKPRPFLERANPITDLDSLYERIKDLKTCIHDNQKKISCWNDYITNISDPDASWIIERDNKAMQPFYSYSSHEKPFYFYSSHSKEIDNVVRHLLINYWKNNIRYNEELIHTCEDELDWLEMKIGISPNYKKNMFDAGSFNFDPAKNHV